MTGRPGAAGDGPALLVADSFRVRMRERDGGAEVRGLARHLERFARAAASAWRRDTAVPGLTEHGEAVTAQIAEFLGSARERLSHSGEGFPRLELRAAATPGAPPVLALALRPLPALQQTVHLVSHAFPAPPHADRKGPNIGVYGELKRRLGDEPLLLDANGAAREGATTSLVWWGPDTAHAWVSATPERVPSVTEAILSAGAVRFAPRSAGIVELRASEVWAVNALHGIRPVASIDGEPLAPPEPDRLARFRALLDASWEPVRAADASR